MPGPNLFVREDEVTTPIGRLKAQGLIEKINAKSSKSDWTKDPDVKDAQAMFKKKNLPGFDKIRDAAQSDLAAQMRWEVPGGSRIINLEKALEKNYTLYKWLLEGFYSGSAYTQQKGENKFSFELYLVHRLESTCQGLRKLSNQRTKCQYFSSLRDNLAGLLARK
jgi:hypothetical protein